MIVTNSSSPSGFKPAVAFLALLAMSSLSPNSRAQDRNGKYNAERQLIEAAKYHYDIENDRAFAKAELVKLIKSSVNPEIVTQTHFLLGKLLDASPTHANALEHYTEALSGRGLDKSDQAWLFKRLLDLKPEAIEPVSALADVKGAVTEIFTHPQEGGRDYSVSMQLLGLGWSANMEAFPMRRRLFVQDWPSGKLTPANMQPEADEEVLDAVPGMFLALNKKDGKLYLHSASQGKKELPVLGKLESATILSEEKGEFLLVWTGLIQHYRMSDLVWGTSLSIEGCEWHTIGMEATRGLLHCTDKQVLSVDLRRRTMQAVRNIQDKPVSMATYGEFAVIKYLDRIEIRSAMDFDAIKWQWPSPLQERVFINRDHVYLLGQKGLVKSFGIRSGHLEWQKDVIGRNLVPFEDEILILTFAQTCISLDPGGKLLWTFEHGWDQEPAILPGKDCLILHYEEGRRIKLNRELLKITGNSDAYKFLKYSIHEASQNWTAGLAGVENVLDLEPGNGQAWEHKFFCQNALGLPSQEKVYSLLQASRSLYTPFWSSGPTLKNLAAATEAKWIWKRQYGPKYYPTLISHRDMSFYLESDNQTLVVLKHDLGEHEYTYRFPEELDLKVGLWKNDTICVSSPTRLYMLSPRQKQGELEQYSLKNPVCQAEVTSGGILYSDWYGELNLVDVASHSQKWSRKLGTNGLLMNRVKSIDYMDVIDLDGNYFAVNPASGKTIWSLALPAGTVTEVFSTREFIFAGYSNGLVVAVDRAKKSMAWSRGFVDQIFSLSGNKGNTLVLTTASKRLICINAVSGAIQSDVGIQTFLFNRPTVTDQGYWLGTTEPALEKRNFKHEVLLKYKLPDLPGSPILFGNSIFISTLDNFILCFPS